LARSSQYTGAAFVFEPKPAAWALRNMIKANMLSNAKDFAQSVAVSDHGKILAAGSLRETAAHAASTVTRDTSARDGGAAWLY